MFIYKLNGFGFESRYTLENNLLNSFLLKLTSKDKVHKLSSQLYKRKALGPLIILIAIPKKILIFNQIL